MPLTGLLALAASLVDIPSVSRAEREIADHLEELLTTISWLQVTRVNHNLVARTDLGRDRRLLLAGHSDTVPPSGNDRAVVEGDVLRGVGSADMKGGVAVLLELARTVAEPAVDVTYVFYECEELTTSGHNGIERLLRERPDLLQADAAVLAEPTGGRVEAGCQGSMWIEVTMTGTPAHTARAWLGHNAVHRLGRVLSTLEAYRPRTVVLDGCEFREGLEAVKLAGGVAGNIVPDRAVVTINHRFAPDRSPAAAEECVREIVGHVDGFRVLDALPAAPPALDHPLLTALLAATGQPPTGKLGWTDVARFAANGVPATNFGPGDPNLAHSPSELVTGPELDGAYLTLYGLIG